MSDLNKSTFIETVASTPDKDITGETLDVTGADISALEEGRGFVNSDHRNTFEHMIGRVVGAKKIMKASDCETPYQTKKWDELKKPYIWAKAEIWDGVGHSEADAVASIYKFYGDKNEDAPIKVSVEGKTLQRGKDGHLKRTVIRDLALTVKPCNRKTHTEVTGIAKSVGADINSLMKSDAPSYIETPEMDPLERIYRLSIAAKQLLKAAGSLPVKNKKIELKSPKLLEELKQEIARLKIA